MIEKAHRVSTKEVEQIFAKGKFLSSQNLTLKFINGNKKKISFIVPKNVAKKAVERNRLRRIGYTILRKHKLPSGVVGVFIFKKPEDNILILENEIKNMLSKIN